MSDDINVGQLSEAINNKMDRDMGNQSTGIHHIIETYVSGTSGYRIWDDGYCEQWGFANKNTTTTLIKTYKDNNWCLTTCGVKTETGTYDTGSINSKTANSFYNVASGSDATGCWWKASGYLASGQY